LHRYIIKRLIYFIPVLIGVSFIVFTIMYLTPGCPATIRLGDQATTEQIERMRELMGLNRPFLVQFGSYLWGVVQGDFGRSLHTNRPVLGEMLIRFPNTMMLSAAGMAIAVVIGILVGVLSSVKQYSFSDTIAMLFALVGISVPNFWFGMMAILIFAVWWSGAFGYSLFPSSGFDDGLRSLFLPALTLGTSSAAIVLRMTRSSMLEVLRQDYIRTARAKGLKERVVVFKHALKNALIPVITVVGLQFGFLLGGAVFTETVFSFPGSGRFIVEAIRSRDLMVVQGGVLFLAIAFSFINLLVDLLYGVIDPRIRTQYKSQKFNIPWLRRRK